MLLLPYMAARAEPLPRMWQDTATGRETCSFQLPGAGWKPVSGYYVAPDCAGSPEGASPDGQRAYWAWRLEDGRTVCAQAALADGNLSWLDDPLTLADCKKVESP
jgi:hypothetical protein